MPAQVRIWKRARSQDEILKWMRRNSGLGDHKYGLPSLRRKLSSLRKGTRQPLHRSRCKIYVQVRAKITALACRDLVAYWQFEDTIQFDKNTGASKPRLLAKDSSHHGNHLPLVNPPKAADVIIENDVSVRVPPSRRYGIRGCTRHARMPGEHVHSLLVCSMTSVSRKP